MTTHFHRTCSTVNAERRPRRPVSVEPRLILAASRYAKALSDNNWFSHTGPDGARSSTASSGGPPVDVRIGEVSPGRRGWAPPTSCRRGSTTRRTANGS
jgi:hypothetical protein